MLASGGREEVQGIYTYTRSKSHDLLKRSVERMMEMTIY